MKKKQVVPKVEPKRPVELIFEDLDTNFPAGNKRVMQFVLAHIFFFGLMGLIWMIPFPQLDFLVRLKWNTFLNWGSFFVAIVLYIYLKLSPSLSYIALFTIGVMSYFIVKLEHLEKNDGPVVWLLCGGLALVSFLALYFTKDKKVSNKSFFKFLLYAPIWLWSLLFNKIKFNY